MAGAHAWCGCIAARPAPTGGSASIPIASSAGRPARAIRCGSVNLTYLKIADRWWHLAAILDQHSRRVLAWRVSATRDATFTRAVVHAALRRRRPKPGLIFHSDRGSEFLGTPFRDRLAKSGILQSMTRGGAPDENARMESFFHSLKAEVTQGRSFASVVELRRVLRRYMPYYNHQRLHSSLGYRSPVDYERAEA